jgi:hypothetical protein
MKTVFTNAQCAHVWAQQTQEHGHSASMSFRGARLYSYSTCIAEIVDVPEYVSVQAGGERKVALLSSNTYSSTTSCKHMPAARRAVANLRSFYVPMLDHAGNLKYLEAEYRVQAAKLLRVRELGSWQRERLTELARNVADYARIFNLSAPVVDYGADYAKATNRMERLANDPKRAARIADRERQTANRRAREALAEVARNVERLAEWRAGTTGTYWGLRDEKDGAYLRMLGDNVQTSLGATVPAADAQRAIKFIAEAARRGGWAHCEEIPDAVIQIGAFTLNRVDPNGDIKAGCHFIQWREIAAIALKLGMEV